jgi:hypothetical protein
MPEIKACPKHGVNYYTRCPVCKKEEQDADGS